MSLPPGFRFHPTDDELVLHYLKGKLMRRPFDFQVISETDVYKYEPWELPGFSSLESNALEWFFYCSRNMNSANGNRIRRSTELGYWKCTGEVTPINCSSQNVGTRKTLIYYKGKPHEGKLSETRTDWVMHEYQLEDKELHDSVNYENGFVLCKIFKKSGKGPKNGEQHVAPFEEGADNDIFLLNGNKKYSLRLISLANDDNNDSDERNGSLVPFSPTIMRFSSRLEEGQNAVILSSAFGSGIGQGAVSEPASQHSVTPISLGCHPSYSGHDIHEPGLIVSDDDMGNLTSIESGIHQMVDLVVPNEDIDEIFTDISDLHKSSFANRMEDEDMWHQMSSESVGGSFLELNDLAEKKKDGSGFLECNDTSYPMEIDNSDCKIFDWPPDPNDTSEEFGTHNRIPAPINNWESNACQEELVPHAGEEEFGRHNRIPAPINNREWNARQEEFVPRVGEEEFGGHNRIPAPINNRESNARQEELVPHAGEEEFGTHNRIPAPINNREWNARQEDFVPRAGEEEFGTHNRIPAPINNRELNAREEEFVPHSGGEVDSSSPCNPIHVNVPSQDFSTCGLPVAATTGEGLRSMITEAHMSRVGASNLDHWLIKCFSNKYEYDKIQADLAQYCTDIRPETLWKLMHGSWMDTGVMDAWFQTLMEKVCNCHVFKSALASWLNLPNGHQFYDTAFESLHKRWGNHLQCKTLIFPILSEKHFFLLVGNIVERRWYYYNSLMHRENDWKSLQTFVIFVNSQLEKLGWNDPSFWSIHPVHGLPQQENSDDCGVFVIAYAEHAAMGKPISFTQSDIQNYRAKIVCDVYDHQWSAWLEKMVECIE